MKAVIQLDVPDWQIGQEVSVYFPDTMIKKSVCKTDSVVLCKDCKHGVRSSDEYVLCNKGVKFD